MTVSDVDGPVTADFTCRHSYETFELAFVPRTRSARAIREHRASSGATSVEELLSDVENDMCSFFPLRATRAQARRWLRSDSDLSLSGIKQAFERGSLIIVDIDTAKSRSTPAASGTVSIRDVNGRVRSPSAAREVQDQLLGMHSCFGSIRKRMRQGDDHVLIKRIFWKFCVLGVESEIPAPGPVTLVLGYTRSVLGTTFLGSHNFPGFKRYRWDALWLEAVIVGDSVLPWWENISEGDANDSIIGLFEYKRPSLRPLHIE